MGQSQQVHENQPGQLSLMAKGYKFIENMPTYNVNCGLKFYEKSKEYMCINKVSLDFSNITSLIECNQYYSVRQKIKTHPYLLTIHHRDIRDEMKKESILDLLQQNGSIPLQDSKKVNVNTMCSLNIFQKYCQAAFLNTKKTNEQLSFTLCFHQQYIKNTLQQQIQERQNRLDHYTEQQIWNILANGISAANILILNGLKQPILSPNAIKINEKKNIRIGEWQFTHFFGKEEDNQETYFLEEGETLIKAENSKVVHIKKEYQYNILKCYYWAPQGTSKMQSAVGYGKLNRQHKNLDSKDSELPKSQVFSFGMTILHMCLLRPLYQKETFSQKRIKSYLSETIEYRQNEGFPLSGSLIELLTKMLKWDPQQRISYVQLKDQIEYLRSSLNTHSRKRVQKMQLDNPLDKTQNKYSKFNDFFKPANSQGSGFITQGNGDEYLPQQEHKTSENKRQVTYTSRNKTDIDSSSIIDYEKIDYTIRRQRNEWKKFNDRIISESSYKVTNNNISKILFLEEQKLRCQLLPLSQDRQDEVNKQTLLSNAVFSNEDQYENMDQTDQQGHQLENYLNSQRDVEDSIKLLDISNIKASDKESNNNSKYFSNPFINLNHQNSIFRSNQVQDFEEKPSKIYKDKFMHEYLSIHSSSDTNLLKSKSNNSMVPHVQSHQDQAQNSQNIFTSPELLALIRTPNSIQENQRELAQQALCKAKRHKPTTKKQINKNKISENVTELQNSTYVKESFSKGYYEGGKHDNLRNGYGTFYYNEGGKYCGDWVNNKMHGKGTLYYSDGRIAYQGQWRNDSLSGRGILYNENPTKLKEEFDYKSFNESESCWIYYEGTFHNDNKWGNGLLCLSNGQKYQGQFKNDVVDGRGIFYTLNQTRIRGQWRKNKLVRLINQQNYNKQNKQLHYT